MENKNKYAVSAGHQLTAEAAADILRAGGNAVDAAVAAFFMSWVAEPCMSSGGGGGFATVFTADGKSCLFDFFCQTPKHKRPIAEVDFYPIRVDFGGTSEDFYIGRGSTGVPGAVAGAFELHEKFGKLPITELVKPAIDAAKNGVVVVPFQQMDFGLLEPILATEKRGKELFFKNNRLVQTGETMYMPQLADYLDYLARNGKNAFYLDEPAQKTAAYYQDNGGFLSFDDFAKYQVIVRKNLCFDYKTLKILTNPQPAYGGLLIKKALAMTEKIENSKLFTAEHTEDLINVFAETEKYSRNPEQLFNKNRATISSAGRGNTTHFSIVDKDGNAVALTASNGEGCGYFIENTDIQLNNMLGEAALLPAGFHSWQTDSRLPSMMSPTVVLDENGQLKIVTGSSGAGRIAPAIAQSLHYIIDGNLSAQAAVDAPRLHVAHGKINLEPGWADFAADSFSPLQITQWAAPSLFYGGVNAVCVENGLYSAGADSRRDGFTSIM